MDLAFTSDELAFALDVRAWLAANVEVPPRFENIADEVEFGRRWQARLAASRWGGIHWPRGDGGRARAARARGEPVGRHPLARGVRRPERVTRRGRDLQHGVRAFACVAADQPR